MPEILKNQIIDWLSGGDHWFQYAGNQLLEGSDLNEDVIQQTYEYFKQDVGLEPMQAREKISFKKIEVEIETDENLLKIVNIKEIENVNALAKGQSIPINDTLTIIYGNNGSGKSGYIRLLNNAFNSRGDKNILQNVFNKGAKGQPSCKFTFQSTADPYDLSYPQDKDKDEFSRFAVFDTLSIKVILEQDNKLNFMPAGFEFFENILKLYEGVKKKLDFEIESKRTQNEFLKYFLKENPVRNYVLNLGALSKENELQALATFTDEDAENQKALIVKCESLKAMDIPALTKQLQTLDIQITEFLNRLNGLLEIQRTENISSYKMEIENYHRLNKLAQEEGIKSLEKYEISGLGSNEWKNFIKVSKEYATSIELVRRTTEYPSINDNCLLCLRPLDADTSNLILAYWNLLKSEAEKQLNSLNQTLRILERKLQGLPLIKFDDSTVVYTYISTRNLELCTKWKEIVVNAETGRRNIITNIANRNCEFVMTPIIDAVAEFDEIRRKLKAEIDDLYAKNPAKEIEKLELEIQFLTDKSLLKKLLPDIIQYIKSHRWAAHAEKKSASAFHTRTTTTKQGELFGTHITDEYTQSFNEECKRLHAPSVVKIVQKNSKAQTLRNLQISGVGASGVLSEGEQRAISLADFLTEVQMNPKNKGVFFDDPVTSQDHRRRDNIAERLAQLAKDRQVIVFTHDIAFFFRLKTFSEKLSIKPGIISMRNIGAEPGIIRPDLPWVAQKVKERIGYLRNDLVHLKKVEKSGDEEAYLMEAKKWYTLLREAWERGVEESLFKGVVERFNPGIQTLKLKSVVVTPELLAEIDKGMTDSSNWVHDSAIGLNPTPPNAEKAVKDLQFFEDFVKKCAVIAN